MRACVLSCLLIVTACHSGGGKSDAAVPEDLAATVFDLALPTVDLRSIDLEPEVDLACTPIGYLGGTTAASQAWTTTAQAPDTISFPDGETTQLATSTTSGAMAGGELLLSSPALIATGQAYAIEWVVQVLAVAPHNQYDAAVALLGSFTAPFGSATDRAEMIYIDSDKVGWGDDSESYAVSSIDGAFHSYILTVTAAGQATVTRDGVTVLTRDNFTTNGIFAFGDQTNDAGIDATTQLRSVRLLCPH